MPSTIVNADTMIIFRVPSSGNNQPTASHHKDYCIQASRLPTRFREQFQPPGLNLSRPSITITLDDNTTAHFDVYEHYLSKGTVCSTTEIMTRRNKSLAQTLGHSITFFNKPLETRLAPDEARTDYENLIACYALGMTLHDRRFQDAVASKIVTMLRASGTHQSQLIRILTPTAIGTIIDQYGTESRLFLLLAAAYARFATVNELNTLVFSKIHGQFKSHVMNDMATLRVRQHVDGVAAPDFVVSECRFHRHGFYDVCPLRKL